ncbi:MAG TPA: sulfite exporter TauE/SafE family protein [Alphaproteobacteria bacterium]|nr:sulfite exporter TauE/SafE family protein [Alphaproteobacteria bacterium]
MDLHLIVLPDLIALVGTGLVAGLIAGLFGVGGGTITVPILYHWFKHIGVPPDLAMHAAVGTSLATIIATSASSARAHEKRGSIDHAVVRSWGPYVAAGSLLGVGLASLLSGAEMRGIFGGFLLCVAIYMLCTNEKTVLYNGLPLGWRRGAVAGGIGLLSSLVGIGGGSLSVPVMTLGGVPMPRAVGTSSAFGAVIAVPGTLGFIISGWGLANLPPLSLGYVNILGLAVLLPATALTAPLGAKLAHKLDRTLLRHVFSVFLMFIALKMLWGLFGK